MPNLRFLLPAVLFLCWCPCLKAVTSASPGIVQVGMIDLPGRPGFDEVAAAKGMLLITHPAANTVDIFDPQKRRIAGQVKGLSSPRGIAVNEADGRVYIANSGASNLVVLSTSDWQVKQIIPVGGAPEALFAVPGQNRLYVTLPAKQSLVAIDTAEGRQIGEAALGGRPEYLAWDSTRERILVTVQDRKEIVAFNSALQGESRFAVNGSMPTGIAFDKQQDRVYVAVRFAVLELDAQSGREITRVATTGGIDQLWLDASTRKLLAVGNGAVFLMNAASRLGDAQELAVDVKGHTLAFDPAKRLIYVPGGREGKSKLLILREASQGGASVENEALAVK